MEKERLTIFSLVSREIHHRKTGFVIGVVCVMAAIGSLVGAITLLRAHSARTEQILVQKEKETREEMERLEDDYRRMMRDMGHNVMILHADQSGGALRSAGCPDTTMPEDYVYKLAEGRVSLNHLLPVLQETITWPEQGMEIILSGTPGQVPVVHKPRFLTDDAEAYKNPIMDPIPAGSLKIGDAVASELGLRPGDTVSLMGKEFVIHAVELPQGDQADIMVWCGLDTAQDWLDKDGKINAIFALECICDVDSFGNLTDEIAAILPDVQIVEFSSKVAARARARQRAEEEAQRAIDAAIEHRASMVSEMRGFAGILVPIVLLASGLWVFFLILGNVRERRPEIGILRAIGVNESRIAAVFLSKALIMGLTGAVLGYLAGVLVGIVWGGLPLLSLASLRMFNPLLFVAALLIAAVLCAVAGWVPALRAAHIDPAEVLRED
ncbi:MAG: ABC transporter permease [Candidatus Brocadiia bacterium]